MSVSVCYRLISVFCDCVCVLTRSSCAACALRLHRPEVWLLHRQVNEGTVCVGVCICVVCMCVELSSVYVSVGVFVCVGMAV